ncbi:Acetylglutamate kinase [Croceitalea dokdonensis DOKDO 023]|uniref:Acetylglutamate kinase n=1 Tax=Croceitalea dokdonensis DOKDO 023 TaxID=1300341 RepID=A0A0P7ALF9_9FLAO|nr:acetylglutamate kinase [Croceitalea dokdonensis]KPM32719.1 Acetylglutamate kinase [Croceitalea dokdonensis DOKDO 023]
MSLKEQDKNSKHLSLQEDERCLSIVKIGGHIIEDEHQLAQFLKAFSGIEGPKILVHGGGKKANQVLEQLGISPKMVSGRRITDADTLDVAIMVYGGLTNKKIVAQLQTMGCNALGMSGADANTIQAVKRPVEDIDFGFVGDVSGVSSSSITHLLNIGLTPVFCALTHDEHGQLLNTNADTIAAELAIGMSKHFDTTLYYCFELNGVLRDVTDTNSVIKKINAQSYKTLVHQGIIVAGMLPKIHNCFHALKNGVKEVRIGNLALFDDANTNYTTLIL